MALLPRELPHPRQSTTWLTVKTTSGSAAAAAARFQQHVEQIQLKSSNAQEAHCNSYRRSVVLQFPLLTDQLDTQSSACQEVEAEAYGGSKLIDVLELEVVIEKLTTEEQEARWMFSLSSGCSNCQRLGHCLYHLWSKIYLWIWKQGQGMEQRELLLAFWVLLVAIILGTVRLNAFRRKFHGKLPPSPFALPLIGHLYLLSRHPHKALAQLSRKYGPYMMLKFGSFPVLIASTSKAAKEILKNNDLSFASRPQSVYGRTLTYDCQDLVMAPYGKHWRDTRKLCTLELFTSKQAAHFRPLREAQISTVIEQLRTAAPGSSVDLREMLTAFNFDVITSMIMGKSHSCQDEDASTFRELIAEREKLSSGAAIGNYMPWLMWLDSCLPKLKTNHEKVDELIEKQVSEHRARRMQKDQHSKDFIDVMLHLCDEGKLGHTTMKALVLNIMTAGTETSATASEWVMAELVRNPCIMSKLQKELDEVVGKNNKVDELHLDKLHYLQAIVKETLRLHPPAPLLVPHESMKECKLGNRFLIPTGTQLFVNVYAIGRDEEVWGEDACDFVPERFLGSSIDVGGQNYELLPFGSGRRSCPGINLALPTVHLMIASLVHEFEWHVPSGEELDMIEGFSFMLRLARPLVLVPSARGM